MIFFLEVEHVKNIFELWILIFFLFIFKRTINDNTHMDEWVYPIIVENIYHNEGKDFPMVTNFPMLSKYFHVLYLKSMYYEQ
jgi:hypothetical protein